jgi:lipoprotein-anchoring transpeptidase ErfK/SrfK
LTGSRRDQRCPSAIISACPAIRCCAFVPNKRIIVNLDTFTLVAYENGQEKFKWKVSSGLDTAPTAPGIYQILNHDELAVGSGVELCGNNGCGQWEMYWFMGIYQISPGLINGFHGAVKLPNGDHQRNVGGRDTYGCIMSEDSNAKMLYDWAEDGTIVEIISNEFEPQSALGRQAKNVSL